MSHTVIAANSKSQKGDIKVNEFDRASHNLGTQEIQGKIYKPSVFYVVARSDFGYKALDVTTSFAPRILRDLKKNPF